MTRMAAMEEEQHAGLGVAAMARAREAGEARVRRAHRQLLEVESHIGAMQGELESAVAGSAGEAEAAAEVATLRDVLRRVAAAKRLRDVIPTLVQEGRAEVERLTAASRAAEAVVHALRMDRKIVGEEVVGLRVQIAIAHSELRRCAAGMAALREEVASVVAASEHDGY